MDEHGGDQQCQLYLEHLRRNHRFHHHRRAGGGRGAIGGGGAGGLATGLLAGNVTIGAKLRWLQRLGEAWRDCARAHEFGDNPGDG